MKTQSFLNIEIAVEEGLAQTYRADVLALKYATRLYGADRAVVEALVKGGADPIESLPEQSGFYITPGKGAIGADQVLFLGVGPLREFGYRKIRLFARRVLETLAAETPSAEHVALTVHGPGYGLDEAESFKSELAGLLDAIKDGSYPAALKRITIVEANTRRAHRLSELLNRTPLLPEEPESVSKGAFAPLSYTESSAPLRGVGYDSESKPNVFVAMPFAEEMDDVYYYGIQGPVNAAGFLCERADLSAFTGDVIDWVKKRIRSASLVVADLTNANPNVYLEVGYAWGCDRPTVLVVRDTADLKFDVRGQKCIRYKRIKDLETALLKELEGLRGTF